MSHSPAPLLAGALVALVVVACAPPDIGVPTDPTFTPSGPDLNAPDPRRGALDAAVGELTATLNAAIGALEEAAAAADVAAGRAAAERAVHLLSADPDLTGDLDRDGQVVEPTVRPLFPGPTERLDDGEDYGDAFSFTLTAARDAGAAGADVVGLLREPIAGDIGVWQQDAGGVLTTIREAIAPRTLDEKDVAVSELPGEGTRALAWALAAVEARELEPLHAYANRGAAHLGLIRSVLQERGAEGGPP